jgi:hypothetical protein
MTINTKTIIKTIGGQQNPEDDVFAFTQADEHIFRLLRPGPMELMTVVNIVGRLIPHKSKSQRIATKRLILLRLGELIRRGQLRRDRRKFVKFC